MPRAALFPLPFSPRPPPWGIQETSLGLCETYGHVLWIFENFNRCVAYNAKAQRFMLGGHPKVHVLLAGIPSVHAVLHGKNPVPEFVLNTNTGAKWQVV